MHELQKIINGKKYEVYGPNAILLDWARRSDLAQSVYAGSGLTEDTFFRTLCPLNPEDEQICAKIAIRSLWRAYPELGPYPFLDTLSDFQFNSQFFPEYREHVIHQLRVFLTGLYLFDLCMPIRTKILEENGCSGEKAGEAEFLRRWTACAIFHDIGYVLENEGGNEPDGPAWIKTKEVMNQCLAAPLFSIFGNGKIHEYVERKIIEDEEIFRPKIDYQKKLEFDKKTDMLDLIADFGTLSSLGTGAAPGKSPLRAYYDYAFSHEPVGEQRPRFRDHGIVGAFLLLRLWFDFRRYLDKFMLFINNPLLGNISQELITVRNRMPECEQSIIAAAGAVSLHNINPTLWNHGDALHDDLTLHSFEIPLSVPKTAMAFLLGLADTLQDWDRPRFRTVRESDRPIPDQRDMHFCSVNYKIRLYFQTDDEVFRNPANIPDSRFSEMKKEMMGYLDRQAVDELLEWGKCDIRHDSREQDEITKRKITDEPETEAKNKETNTDMNETANEPENLDDLIYIISAPGDIKTARNLYNDLKAEGLNPWMESYDLEKGANMKHMVKKHLRISKYVLALISKNAATEKGIAQRELKIALDEFEEFPPDNIYLIPVRLENYEIYHPQLDELNPVNLFESYPEGLKQILKVVGKNLKKRPGRQAVPSEPKNTSTPASDIAVKIEEIEVFHMNADFRKAYLQFYALCKETGSIYQEQAVSILTQFNAHDKRVVQRLYSSSDEESRMETKIAGSFRELLNRFKEEYSLK